VAKAEKDETLSKALENYKEALSSDIPIYGLYKVIEGMSKKLDGRKQLAQLINEPKKYIDDIMQTAQPTRHDSTEVRKMLSETECNARTKKLLDAYIKNLPMG
jgi:predicted transcriptional regulator